MVPLTVKLVKLEWEKGRSGTNVVLKVDVKGRLVTSVMKMTVTKCELEGELCLALQGSTKACGHIESSLALQVSTGD
uniref:Uncharacterized protein n=1 Tax=Asparagus officinalis TaxID=4686 RepID=Q2AA30_ASPOF|nr:hypothetical protein 20.t00020 [Asparagus officinalis]